MKDIETAQRAWQNRGYDLIRDPSVIKYKNSLQSLNVNGFWVASLLCHFEFLYLITLGSLIKSYPLFYHALCAVSMSFMCGGKCGIVIPVQCSSGIRGVCCYGYAGIGRISRFYAFLADIVLNRGLSTVYVAACSIC
ncbi:MAG: hypothetical protein EZS28_047240 [Streblomastix strix]|uniref:Uncharacterized protein n=1 Tax=Streblomastix strix TaxID=222440 RepID=A0A5J4TFJ6_9EUKA|nr:MAG: hypothetical protein EZS28_047240 [Streblomastix strix]